MTFSDAVSGVARAVHRHPARPHRQGRAGRVRRRAGPGDAGDRRAVPRREHRPAARRDPAGPQRPVLGGAGAARPHPDAPGGRAGRAGRLDAQRRHPGGPSARRRSGFRATVGDPGRAHGQDHDAADHAAVAARRAAEAGRRAGAPGDPRPARRRPAGGGRGGQRQHRHAGAGADPRAVRPRLRADRAARVEQGRRAGVADECRLRDRHRRHHSGDALAVAVTVDRRPRSRRAGRSARTAFR